MGETVPSNLLPPWIINDDRVASRLHLNKFQKCFYF